MKYIASLICLLLGQFKRSLVWLVTMWAQCATCSARINRAYGNLLSALAAFLILLVTGYYVYITHELLLATTEPDVTIEPHLIHIKDGAIQFSVVNRGNIDVRNLQVYRVVYFADTAAMPLRILETETNTINAAKLKAGTSVPGTSKLAFLTDPGSAEQRKLYATGKGHIICQFYFHYKHGVTRKPGTISHRYSLVIDSLMRLDEGFEGFSRLLDQLHKTERR